MTKETNYVIDYLSDINNELLSLETGYGATRVTYGHQSERLSQKVTIFSDTPKSIRTEIAKENSKSYFQSDLLGSVLFASNQQGEILRYAQRDVWGNLRIPMQGDMNSAGIENSIQFTNHSYDSVIDKYFAKARFYDADQGRMLAIDPIKTGINAYLYCMNNPVNYIDPDGEMSLRLFTTAAEAVVGGVFRLTSYVSNQKASGKKVNFVDAVKETASGVVRGAVNGFIAGSSPKAALGSLTWLVTNAVTRSVHNKVTTGKINFGNVAKEVLYDRYGGRPTPVTSNTNSTVGSSKMSGTSNVSTNTKHPFEPQKTGGTGSVADTKSTLRPTTTPSTAPNTSSRDPRTSCGGNGNSYGYNYGTSNTVKTRPSTMESLRERWANPNTLINDVSTVTLLAGAGGLGKAAVAIVKNVKKTVTKGTSILKDFMKDNRGGINVPKGVGGATRTVNGFDTIISAGKQGKHIVGHNNYIKGKSIFSGTIEDAQKLVSKFAGKGEWIGNNKERINFGKVIGKYVDSGTGEAIDTTVGIIHYSKSGTHIVPAKPIK